MSMNLLSGSGRLAVGPIAPGLFDNLSTERVSTTESGFLIVYVDNQTIGKDVWFDNVQVLHYNTQVLEENHYYPYGLTVSASAMGMTPQPLKYNGKELETSFDLQTYEYGARQYNSQIGRWNGIDPLADKYYNISPFAYVANNPVKFIDPDGRVIMDASMKNNYPNFYNYVNNHLENYFLNSPLILKTLSKYTVGGLNRETIKSAMKPGNGPKVVAYDYSDPNHRGEYHVATNTIRINRKLIQSYENVMNGDPKVTDDAKRGMTISITGTFINEFTHFGDALDGWDAIMDGNGNVVNDYTTSEDEPIKQFDEGNEAVSDIFPISGFPSSDNVMGNITKGILNVFLRRDGQWRDSQNINKVNETDLDMVDPTVIPPIDIVK